MRDRYLVRPREEITAGARFTRAMDGFAAALDAPERKFSGYTLVDRFLDVEHALFLLHGVPEDNKDTLTHGLAGRGA